MRAIRRTVRTAAVATGAVAALALPAHAAFAASPAPAANQTEAGQTAGETTPEVLPGTDEATPDVKPEIRPEVLPGKPDVTPEIQPEVKPEVKPEVLPGKDKEKDRGKDGNKVRQFVTTVRLADGSVAKVYKIGPNHFEAVISANGVTIDTLVSKDGRPSYGQNNGLHVVLQPNGTVTSWVEGGKKQQKPQHKKHDKHEQRGKKTVPAVSVATVKMPDGRIAKLIKGGKNGPRVEISMPNGNHLGTLDLKHPSTVNDGWTYKIVKDGKRAKFVVVDCRNGGDSWVYDFHGKLVEQYKADRRTGRKAAVATSAKDAGDTRQVKEATAHQVLPKGGVKAGAEGVEGKGSDTPVLVAAGGGMAAAGAAGLGFALLRRGRHQG
ncbi:hypothetical protein ACIQUQ_10270 [Streptomyces sp. NPDC101118]|uniref:hypothetical protein n=1 Tax=Streptomyces sp. NPDC101118 TaxID=3366109 RepID=UPI0037F1FF03